MSGSQTRFLTQGLLLDVPAVSCPIPSTLGLNGGLKHLNGDLLTQELVPVPPELLYTRVLDTAMWRVEPVYSLIAGGREGGALSQLLQNKLQRHMHARAHTRTHLFSRARGKRRWFLQVEFSDRTDVSRSWLRLDGRTDSHTRSPTDRRRVLFFGSIRFI